MKWVIDADINELGKNGREYFINHYTLDRFINRLLKQMNSVIGKKLQ